MIIALLTRHSSFDHSWQVKALVRVVLIPLALVVCFVCIARAAEEEQITINMSNGDRLSGKFVSADKEKLQIETSYGGRIGIKTEEIKEWETPSEQVRQTVAALIPQKAKTTIEGKVTPATAQAEQRETPVVWKRSLNFAYSFARGNSDASDLRLSLGISRKRGPGRVAFALSGRRSDRDELQEAHWFNATFRYEHPLAKLPAFSETTFEVDHIQQLKYRLSQSAGLSYHLFEGQHLNAGLDFGAGLSREAYSNGGRKNLAISLVRVTAEQKAGEKLQLDQQLTVFSNLFRPSNTRLEAEASMTMPLTKRLALKVAGLDRYDRRPQEGAKSNDFSLSTGFKFTF